MKRTVGFPKWERQHHFTYDSTNNWNNLNAEFLSHYQVVIFLDTRPEDASQREAFEEYMKKGAPGWVFIFQDLHSHLLIIPRTGTGTIMNFLGAGSYLSNTWRPTSAVLRVMDKNHPVTRNLPDTFRSSAK